MLPAFGPVGYVASHVVYVRTGWVLLVYIYRERALCPNSGVILKRHNIAVTGEGYA
jgi:hypothetical protein